MKRLKLKRKSERWVTNNRVLLGMAKKDPGRNPNFDNEETKLLISLWGEPTVQRTLITTHRKHNVIVKLAEKMGEYGYSRSPDEINTRIKNLKCFYNRLKKDLDMGIIHAATWKHFASMDEIMNRSIFSVRPNEIPKPSLKYQLEQQLEANELEERNKLEGALTKPDNSSLANAQNLDEHFSNSSNSCEDEAIEENDAHTNCDGSVSGDYMKNEKIIENGVKIKEEEFSDSGDIEETPLIIPKDEPIDEIDEIVEDNANDMKTSPDMPSVLPDYFQIPNNNTNSILMNPSQFLNGNLNSAPSQTLQTGITPSILFANPTNPMQGAGKISLVPTNFLLQQNAPQTQQLQICQQSQQRIICTQPNTQTNAGIVTSSGAGRMKVLLVNAFQNGNASNMTAQKDAPFTNPGLISTANTFKTNTTDSGVFKSTTGAFRTEEASGYKDPVIELLFNKLIAMQNENNEIQKQRLELERQRLDFEKSIADKLLSAFTSLSQGERPTCTNDEKTRKNDSNLEYINNAQSTTLTDNLNSFPLLTPKLEKNDE